MPTISFDTIEHSDVTGLEVTRHDYVIFDEGTSNPRVHYHKDGKHQCFYYGNEAQQLINSLIHDKTKVPKNTKTKAVTEFPDDRPTNQRQGYLVGSGDGTQGDVADDAVQGVYSTAQLRCFE